MNNNNNNVSSKNGLKSGIIAFIVMIFIAIGVMLFGLFSDDANTAAIGVVAYIMIVFIAVIILITSVMKSTKNVSNISNASAVNQVNNNPSFEKVINIRYGKEKFLECLKSLPVGMTISINNNSYIISNNNMLMDNKGNTINPEMLPGVGKYNLYNLNYKIVSSNNLDGTSSNQNFVQATIPLFYQKSLDMILEEKINLELNNHQFDGTLPMVEKRKNILTIIFAVILFIEMLLVFFHPISLFSSLLLGVITWIIYFVVIKKVNINKILVKEIKARPDENMKMVIASIIDDKVKSKTFVRMMILIMAIIVPCLIFMKPKMMYEKNDIGYTLRYYTIGIINDNIVTIPETYDGLPVTEIRGEVFKNVSSIDEVKLPSGLKEIRGNTFQNSSIKRITIPNGVTRIGAHAFHNCYNLSEVVIPRSVMEIGSSAFRNCPKLYEVTINRSCSVNSRAFKESPTSIQYYDSFYE